MTPAKRGSKLRAWAYVAALLATPVTAARADLHLCNRTSYVLDLSIGLAAKGAVATRGWFRMHPGQCRAVLQGDVDAEHIYVHSRPHAVYGDQPQSLARHAELCIADENFVIAGARNCPSGGQRMAPFTEVKPSDGTDGATAHIAEAAEYDVEQARLAGIQRLLTLAGYDAEPIDGIEGRRTEAAVAQFLNDRKLASANVETPVFFEILLEAAEQSETAGLSWCNDTGHAVMAALGAEERGAIVTRGWYRVAAGRCLRPDLTGKPERIYSFAEAVDAEGRALRRGDKPIAWGGQTVLCTRDLKFEVTDQKGCAERGLRATGFALVDLGERRAATVRFRD